MSSLEQKRERLKALLQQSSGPTVKDASPKLEAPTVGPSLADYESYSYDMFMASAGERPVEAERFADWVRAARSERLYAFESPRIGGQRTRVEVEREDGARLELLNFSSYNYLGLGHHPEVIAAAHEALERYGLGAASSPVISGTFDLHQRLEQRLVDAYGACSDQPLRAALFSSGYGVNIGVIPAIVKPGNYVVLDQEAHMSLLDGARLSGGNIEYFRHNDPAHLAEVLGRIRDGRTRMLVCVEGCYSAGGEIGRVAEICEVARRHGAQVLVDEAHSALLTGPHGLGVSAEQGVLDAVDYLVLTFSKALGGVGGAVLARRDLIEYINWYARSRFFSCALDPAVTGGMIAGLELALSTEGEQRRARLHANAARLRERLGERVRLGNRESWIVPVIFGADALTLRLNDWLQRNGLDTSIMGFPATPRNEARIRMFSSSEHTSEQCDEAARIILAAADHFGFATA